MEQTSKETLTKDREEFVSCIMINKDRNVVIFKRREDLALDAGKYDFCSGHIKKGEVPTQSMYREINEEIGLNPGQINLRKLGIIGTPHKDFNETLCHVYMGRINESIEKINEMIKNVEHPELEEAICLENIEQLREEMQDRNNNYRMIYTKEMKYFLEAVEQRLNQMDLQEEKDIIR